MEAERWKRIRELFDAAVELPPVEREPFLTRLADGDSELVEEVRSLLEHDQASDAPIRETVARSKLDVGAMTLDVGDRLGTYEVTSVIGVGGMGEVYRARDSALERDVAIKVIPDAFASDATRLARFEREAKVLASLSHPNIASIYGLETSADAPALVLELVEGETLAEILSRGPLPLARALSLASQLAEALDAAHQRGIVHRDFKPGNIKVTRDGIIKVLDFGLAKTLEKEGPTETSKPTTTREGAVLGTAAYMSPEQARGEPVDKRTDIWAYGVVFYEMLTGRRLFPGDNVSDTLAAVLRDEIVLDALPPQTPPLFTRLLKRCVERDPNRRLRDIGDARLEIEEANELASGGLTPGEQLPRPRRAQWLPVVAAVCIAALATWFLSRVERDLPSNPSRFTISLPQGVSVGRAADFAVGSTVALSPDGQAFAFTGVRNGEPQIYLRALDRLSPQPLLGSEGGHTPFFSPDGQWIGFLSDSEETDDVTLKKVPATGGDPVVLSKGGYIGASWGGKDRIVLGSSNGLVVVPAGGGAPSPLFELAEPEAHHSPHFVLDGEAVLFYVWTGSAESMRIDVVYPDTGERHTLLQGVSPKFTASGHLVFVRGESLWAARLDPKRLTVVGEPVRVLDELDVSVGGLAAFDLARDGSLLYTRIEGAPERTLVWVDVDGNETPIDAPVRDYSYPRVSPDGSRIAFTLGQVGLDVWIYDVARSMLTRFTSHPTSDSDAEWSPDGSQIAFHSHRDGGGDIYLRAADGAGEITRITSSSGEKLVTSWAPDAQFLVYSESHPGTPRAFFRLTLDGSNTPSELLRTSANLAAAMLSPDGRWLAYVSDESGRTEVYVRPYPDVQRARWQVSSGGGRAPVWSLDGRAIYLRRGAAMIRVSVDAEQGFMAGKAETLFDKPFVSGAITDRSYDLAPDGRFLMLEDVAPEESETSRSRLVLVQNWTEELDGFFQNTP